MNIFSRQNLTIQYAYAVYNHSQPRFFRSQAYIQSLTNRNDMYEQNGGHNLLTCLSVTFGGCRFLLNAVLLYISAQNRAMSVSKD